MIHSDWHKSRYEKSLTASWREGIPASIMLVVMDYYLVPYALFLGAGEQLIGLVVAVPHLLGAFFQLMAARIIHHTGSRLRFLIVGSILQVVVLIPVAMLALTSFRGRAFGLLVLASLFRILSNWIGTAWGSLMSEYLPAEQRGKYFGMRSCVAGIAGMAGLAIAGSILYLFRSLSMLPLGFCAVFLFIALCRLISCILFTKMEDLPFHEGKESRFSFFMFIRRMRHSNFVRFVLFVAGITFATQMASPYFSVYLLKNLHYDYLLYTVVHMSSLLAAFIGVPFWGRMADHAGNVKVLKMTAYLIPVIPILWLLSKHPIYLILVEMFAGFLWGGFNLAATNFIFDAVSSAKRVRCLAYFNLIIGFAIFAGAGFGGMLVNRLPVLYQYPIYSLFLLSGVLRFLALFLLSGKFRGCPVFS